MKLNTLFMSPFSLTIIKKRIQSVLYYNYQGNTVRASGSDKGCERRYSVVVTRIIEGLSRQTDR